MPKDKKQRVDQLIYARGLVESRAKAQALIMAGKVYSGDKKILKSGDLIAHDSPLTIKAPDHPWVSRGGVKLHKALAHFSIDVKGMTAIDVGASTGGFTDVLLQGGAKRVYAVDVGRGQLHWKLRTDSRVVVCEGVNARYLTPDIIPEISATPADIIVCDASFISLEKLLPAPLSLTRRSAWLVALIKPQFQVEKAQIGKKGIIRDPALHRQVCARVADWVDEQGWQVVGITESPIRGAGGNTEFLLAARQGVAHQGFADDAL